MLTDRLNSYKSHQHQGAKQTDFDWDIKTIAQYLNSMEILLFSDKLPEW